MNERVAELRSTARIKWLGGGQTDRLREPISALCAFRL